MYANEMSDRMLGSCLSLSKAMNELATEWGVLTPQTYSGFKRADQLCELVRTIVREECRRAVEEAAFRIFRLANQSLPMEPDEGLYVPKCEIVIHAGNVGTIALRSFHGVRANRHSRPNGKTC